MKGFTWVSFFYFLQQRDSKPLAPVLRDYIQAIKTSRIVFTHLCVSDVPTLDVSIKTHLTSRGE